MISGGRFAVFARAFLTTTGGESSSTTRSLRHVGDGLRPTPWRGKSVSTLVPPFKVVGFRPNPGRVPELRG